jgi:FSR family fosmidomycin resistance protein-like MFS transporter
MALFLVLALALGKAAGGVLADRFGARLTSCVTLIAACVLFVFHDNAPFGILAVFFFNMTMPITLGAMMRLLPRAYGFGFGLLTFGLFLGAAPFLSGMSVSLPMPLGACAACIISAVLLFIGVREKADGD